MIVITVARKPLEGSVAANVLKHGCGAINVDASRIATTEEDRQGMLKMSEGFAGRKWGRPEIANYGYESSMPTKTVSIPALRGRWPANVILSETAASALDAQSGILTSAIAKEVKVSTVKGQFITNATTIPGVNQYGDEGGASRFFKVVQDA